MEVLHGILAFLLHVIQAIKHPTHISFLLKSSWLILLLHLIFDV